MGLFKLRAYLVLAFVEVVVKIIEAANGFRKEKIMTIADAHCVSGPDRPAIMRAGSPLPDAMLSESSIERIWRTLSLTTLRAGLVLAVALVVAEIVQTGAGLPGPLVVR